MDSTSHPAPESDTGPVEAEIRSILQVTFSPELLDVSNDSAMHRGHSGDDGTGESHFTVTIVADAFRGVSRLERQRMVNRALGDLPGQRVHALAIKAKAPGEV
ncbi:BolA family protein [Croceicoccus naphthovorans]|uniref:BolA family transcriptional regulator n=1 Tax=Croceicoccus naphthovorans TaxID=1348774 RepID=A0A0G3XDG8_9SPHN|nr:BolA family protein [Croceicoccus naphthovorans]AKM09232.1 BolA family transcriptional regulator [Croceicoccus naphthovorans]MBB3990380.1 BolA protein [Croceicoccus naphthovorans]